MQNMTIRVAIGLYGWQLARFKHTRGLTLSVQESASRVAELEANNMRVLQDLADFKTESKELRNQDLTIKRMEAQLGQLKAQLQNKVG